MHGTPIPVNWLLQQHDSRRYPDAVVVPRHQQQADKQRSGVNWVRSREQWIAAAAAGVHVAMFAWNLAFWGNEGMPPDRYWPSNTRRVAGQAGAVGVTDATGMVPHTSSHAATTRRLKMGIKPGQYGNLDGTRRVWYDNLAAAEGVRW
jgi:hypothetical protein